MPVYQEGDEINESTEPLQVNPTIAVTARVASRQSSGANFATTTNNTNTGPESPSRALKTQETPKNGTKHQGPVGNELPFNDYVNVNKTGFKG